MELVIVIGYWVGLVYGVGQLWVAVKLVVMWREFI
jgi:hypothetical protein